MDDDLVQVGRIAIGKEFGLTAEQSRRLRGETVGEVRADAKAMRHELGLPSLDQRDRDDRGRFAGSDNERVNQAIRAAAGR
jgi:hypothetical protein